MIRRLLFPLGTAAALAALSGSVGAQENPKPETAKQAPKAETAKEGAAEPNGPHGITLRVQLVITRFQGERKVASLPYTLLVTTGGGRARMRMGVDTPVAVATAAPGSGKPLTTSFEYRNVGTNIDCAAWDKGDGRYQLNIGLENSSALALEKGPSGGASPGGPPVDANPTGSPLFRRFDANLDPWLRDGQSVQTVASTDPVTGEVVKVDVTLNVVK
ncbi:MAG TPA: hypothetical protein VMT70_19160 [Vicinamibacteria bacterium]|nr:hypothetical protein [Vicinamibacteria bacterium]